MQDPYPENIAGRKQVSHSVEWQVNVGYALLGLAAIYAIWKLSQAFVAPGETEDEQDPVAEFEGLSDGAETITVK